MLTGNFQISSSMLDEKLKAVSDEAEAKKLKKILILLSDTGGGHRASAGALEDALNQIYGSDALQITILDIWTDYGNWPFNSFVAVYRFASENPWCWKMLYQSSCSPISRSLFLSSGYAVSGANFGRVFRSLNPDLVISVHPLCQHVPLQIMAEMERTSGSSMVAPPFVTVVTDLGAAHPTWFHPRATRVYVPSDSIRQTALIEGVKPSRIQQFGLPLRRAFWKNPDCSKEETRLKLGLKTTWKTCLIIGGGEGVGGLDDITSCVIEAFLLSDEEALTRISKITSSPHFRLLPKHQSRDVELQIIIVCGKNEHTRRRVLNEITRLTINYTDTSQIILDDRSKTFIGPGGLNHSTTQQQHTGTITDQSVTAGGVKNWSIFRSLASNTSTREQVSEDSIGDGRVGKSGGGIALKSLWTNLTKGKINEKKGVNYGSSTGADGNILGSVRSGRSPFRDGLLRVGNRSASEDCRNIEKVADRIGERRMSRPLEAPGSSSSSFEFLKYRSGSSNLENGSVSVPIIKEASLFETVEFEENDCEKFVHTTGCKQAGKTVRCVVYGFASNMDELMAASDLLITKAGPGTIVEATTRGLPMILSSYLPGQEEGNVAYVIENKFGTYCIDPNKIGLIAREWLTNPIYKTKLKNMAIRAINSANPTASLQIAKDLAYFLHIPIIGEPIFTNQTHFTSDDEDNSSSSSSNSHSGGDDSESGHPESGHSSIAQSINR